MTLVTAILPTRGRPESVQKALACVLAQTLGAMEVLVVDDSHNPSFPDGIPDQMQAAYIRVHEPSLGAKLNLACSLANGEYIIHFHDDDFSAPGRIADQVARLQQSRKACTNYRNLIFTDGRSSWKNTNWPGGYGTSLCHRRDWWQDHRFPSVESEDWHFVSEAMRADQFIAGDAGELMQCRFSPASCVLGEGWIPQVR